MALNEVEKKLIEIIRQDPETPISQMTRLGKIKTLSDTRDRILIVDDELETLLPLKRALEAEDYPVIVKGIIKGHSGTIWVESTMRNGSRSSDRRGWGSDSTHFVQ